MELPRSPGMEDGFAEQGSKVPDSPSRISWARAGEVSARDI